MAAAAATLTSYLAMRAIPAMRSNSSPPDAAWKRDVADASRRDVADAWRRDRCIRIEAGCGRRMHTNAALHHVLHSTPRAPLACSHTPRRAVPVQSEWTTWALLGTTGALGLYAEENSKLGAALSSNVVTMVAALVLANLGALPTSSPVYGTVVKKLVPLAVAALLFDADLDRVRREGRRLLAPFVVAALGTIAGTVVAWRLVPLQRGIPALAARATMASALTARHIGGAVNYVSVAEYGGAAPELVAAGIAAVIAACIAARSDLCTDFAAISRSCTPRGVSTSNDDTTREDVEQTAQQQPGDAI